MQIDAFQYLKTAETLGDMLDVYHNSMCFEIAFCVAVPPILRANPTHYAPLYAAIGSTSSPLDCRIGRGI